MDKKLPKRVNNEEVRRLLEEGKLTERTVMKVDGRELQPFDVDHLLKLKGLARKHRINRHNGDKKLLARSISNVVTEIQAGTLKLEYEERHKQAKQKGGDLN